MKCWIRWETRNPKAISQIRERFRVPRYTTVNGLSPADIGPEDIPLFENTAARGFYSIIRQDWSTDGLHYTTKVKPKNP